MEKTKALEEIEAKLAGRFKEAYTENGEDVLAVDKDSFLGLLQTLKEPPYGYAMLLDMTCVDYLADDSSLEMVYLLLSIPKKHRLRVKVRLVEGKLSIPSLTPLWKNADWLECEVYDMFGVQFEGHPYLRRLFMNEEFEGHPLLKSYPLRKRQPFIPMRK